MHMVHNWHQWKEAKLWGALQLAPAVWVVSYPRLPIAAVSGCSPAAPKVADLKLASAGHQQVLWLDVTMHHLNTRSDTAIQRSHAAGRWHHAPQQHELKASDSTFMRAALSLCC